MKKILVIISTIAAFAMSGTAFAGNYGGGQNNNDLAYLHMFEGSPYSTDCYQIERGCKPLKPRCQPQPRCKPKPPVVSCKPRCAPKPPKVARCEPRCKPRPPVATPCQPRCKPRPPVATPCKPRCKPQPPVVNPCGTGCDTFGYSNSGKRYDRYGKRIN